MTTPIEEITEHVEQDKNHIKISFRQGDIVWWYEMTKRRVQRCEDFLMWGATRERREQTNNRACYLIDRWLVNFKI